MQVKVLCSLSESNGVDAVAPGDRLNQTTRISRRASPVRRLSIVEGQRAWTVTHAVKEQPSGQGSRFRMMAQHPEFAAPDLVAPQFALTMQQTDGAGRRHALRPLRRLGTPMMVKHWTTDACDPAWGGDSH